MKKIFMIAVCLFSVNILAQQTTTSTFGNENYIHNVTFLFPFSLGQESNATNAQKLENITYFDGLGRPIQQIGIRHSPLLNDIVTHIEYDSLGRQSKNYLPYATTTSTGLYRTDALTKTNTFYNTIKYQNTTNPYSEKFFDKTPLNLVVESAAPGNAWKEGIVNEHTMKNEYKLVETSDNVYNLQVTLGTTNTLVNKGLYVIGPGQTQGTYLAPTLYKFITKNENWKASDGNNNTVHTFKDFRGRTVLKRIFNNNIAHDTYYVYDNYNNLSFIISPKVTISNGVDATELSELCYQYRYDEKNRLVEKKIPGKGWEYIIYDSLDRPVLTQDANQRDKNGDGIINDKDWLFTKYDKFGRVAYTGIYTHASVLGRAAMQSYFDTQNNSAEKSYEIKEESLESLEIYYSNNDFPNTSLEVLTVNYYDNYVFDRAGLGLPSSIGIIYGKNITTNAKGLATGRRMRVLGTNDWITTVTYYDEKAQPIYLYSQNDYLETTDIVTSKLDFTGKTLETRSVHKKTGKADIVTIDTFTYDHANRLLDHNQCVGGSNLISCTAAGNSTDITLSSVLDLQTSQTIIDNNSITLLPGFHAVAQAGQSASFSIAVGAPELITSNTYDELGQLENKKVGNTSSNPLQTVDYKYNIRGWLTDINQDANNNDNDLFNFSLRYNNPTSGTALYNGNISQTSWSTLSHDTSTKTYTYTYDDLDRIKSAISSNANYNLDLVTYDKNGNILSLKRQGHTNNDATLFGVMDDLIYNYDGGNKLTKVLDNGNGSYGFKDGASNSIEYTYDVNGNMKTDQNKGITGISYNHLNLPTQVNIKGQVINYTYDAAGAKLRKVVNGTTTDYAGNHIYNNNNLQFFSTPEGYFNVTSTSGVIQGNYVYQYKDHLGNVRLSYTDSDEDGKIDIETNGQDLDNNGIADEFEIVEESNYYPFGLKHKGYNSVVNNAIGNSVAQKYKYNGKELNEELGLNWYDYGARNYDPTIGRWMNIDALAEKAPGITPFRYGFNNPINFIDPDGNFEKDDFSGLGFLFNDDLLYGSNSGSSGNLEDILKRYKDRTQRVTYDESNQRETITKSSSSGDDWVEDSNGKIYWDKNATSQATTKKGEKYIGKTFTGKDQNGNIFVFNKDGSVKKLEATVPMIESAGVDTSSMKEIVSKMIDDGKSKLLEGSLAASLVIVADDSTVAGIVNDIALPFLAATAIVGVLMETSPTFEFAAEHRKRRGSKKKTNDKHTKPRSGRPNTRQRKHPKWRQNPNKGN